MGGAFRSVALAGEALVGNPAAMSLRRRYDFDVAGAYDSASKFSFASIAIVDSQTTPNLAAGVGYHYVNLGRFDRNRTANLTTLAFSAPLSENLYFGLGGKYLLMSGARTANAITVDAGLLLRITDSLLASVSGHNLIDIRNPDLTRYWAGSLGYVSGPITVVVDLRADFETRPDTKLAVGAGLEYIAASSFPLRLGYSHDNIANTDFISGGVGYATSSGGLDFSYRHELGGLQGRLFSVGFRL
jgi:opacity protein-like surface antigen